MALQDAVYCTLLLSDNYLPGAMVLAHSLRDNGTTAKLVALYTPETLQPETISELQTIYDALIAVPPIPNTTTQSNLWLIERPDLITTFTKIELWRQTQFRRIVYIDCDVVALRAPDELLSLDDDDDVPFAAAPDVGWPDCFNSGVMVLRPNLRDYTALRALAERGVSFDGADQGLLNIHFGGSNGGGWHRLGFGYNCTPSANYQYLPAFNHYGDSISLMHFIGGQKPWDLPREVVPRESPYNQLLGRWWDVYDRHYRDAGVESVPVPGSLRDHGQDYQIRGTTMVQEQVVETSPVVPEELPDSESLHTGESAMQNHPKQLHHVHDTTTSNPDTLSSLSEPDSMSTQPDLEDHTELGITATKQKPALSVVPQYVRGEENVSIYVQPILSPVSQTREHPQEPRSDTIITPSQPEVISQQQPTESEYNPKSVPERAPSPPVFEPPMAEWDASREPPPQNTKPEAITLQQQTYTMSSDTRLFQPPESYPEAPKDMYDTVPPTKPEPEKVVKVFPWEGRVGRPTRVFPELTSAHGHEHEREREQITASSYEDEEEIETPEMKVLAPWTPPSPSIIAEQEAAEEKPTPSFENYTHSNAWDDVPEIQQYIESIQKARETTRRSQGTSGNGTPRSSLSTPSTSSVAVQDSGLRDKETGREGNASTTITTTEAPDFLQDDWTSLTLDGFVHILQIMYLYCNFTTTMTTTTKTG